VTARITSSVAAIRPGHPRSSARGIDTRIAPGSLFAQQVSRTVTTVGSPKSPHYPGTTASFSKIVGPALKVPVVAPAVPLDDTALVVAGCGGLMLAVRAGRLMVGNEVPMLD
jgi:hypothetical protein